MIFNPTEVLDRKNCILKWKNNSLRLYIWIFFNFTTPPCKVTIAVFRCARVVRLIDIT